MQALEVIEVETGPAPDAAVIWLHGLGADGHDFEPAVPMLALGPEQPVRFLFPHAPIRPVTLNAGMRMRAWYDLADLEPERQEDEPGIRAAAEDIGALVASQARAGIPSHRVVIGGFSQGGALALFAGLRYSERLAGIIGLSCYLPLPQCLATEISPANQKTRVFQGHGQLDPVVPSERGLASHRQLTAADCQAEWHTYPLAHSVSPDELQDVQTFLQRCLPPVTGED
ncbi:MAG: alpha/beta hydrolase [Gammaproteobacteria bacterium]